MARLRYVREVRGNLFWEPTPAMRELGFAPIALGPRTPESEAKALALYQDWLKVRGAPKKVTSYPPGSLGAFWDRWQGKGGRPAQAWAKMQPRSREDYHRAWKHIDAWRPDKRRPTLSRTVLSEIDSDLCEAFADHMAAAHSPSERYRTVKCFKALLADAVVRLRLGYASPAETVSNPQPAGRSAIWLRAEIPVLCKAADALGLTVMSLAIRTAWETLFSPVDVRTLTAGQLKRDREGWYVERSRTKTDAQAFAAISGELAADLRAYMDDQPFEYTPDTPIFRQRDGNAFRSKDTFGDYFREVRAKAFPGDKRQFLDFRRSGSTEADAAGADKATIGELLANGLADSAFLDATYIPPTVAKAREVARQRLEGGARLAAELTRVRSDSRR